MKKRWLFLAAILAICLLLVGGANKKEIVGYEYHTCERLWDLLVYCPEDMDRWEFLKIIEDVNGIENSIVYEGRYYMVPVFEED